MQLVVRTIVIVLAAFALASPAAQAQVQIGGTFVGGGFSPYGGIGFSPYGGYGYGGGFGFSPYGGYGGLGAGFGYGPFNYGQQLYQQQSSLGQQIFMQQQQVVIDQLQSAQSRLQSLDTAKQQLFQQYLAKTETEKAVVRSGLMRDYLNLDPRGREGWRRDAVVQIIIGQDLQRLDGLAQFREMSAPDKSEFRGALLDKYHSLSLADQQAWQNDQIVGSILGRDWWLK